MAVGNDDAVLRHDHAGAEGVLHTFTCLRGRAKELAEDRVIGEGRGALAHDAACVDVHHRRRDLLDKRRVGELDFRLALGHPPLGGKGIPVRALTGGLGRRGLLGLLTDGEERAHHHRQQGQDSEDGCKQQFGHMAGHEFVLHHENGSIAAMPRTQSGGS